MRGFPHCLLRREYARVSPMSYLRVIPRDLFNEAKLLKCLGQLALVIHDGVRVPRGLSLEHETPEEGFQIEQDDSSGELYCSNLSLFCRGRLIGLRASYNDKGAYPLRFTMWEGDEGNVFNPDGSLSDEFHALCAGFGSGMGS